MAMRLRSLIWRTSIEEEVDGELAFHVEMRTRELVERGLEPAAARAEALRRFGDVARVNATCRRIARQREREMRHAEYLDELGQDLRFAARQLVRHPAFALIAIVTLALGIGANTAIFSVVNAVLLRPLPYADAGRLAVASLSVPDYRDLRAASTAFDDMAIWASNLYDLNVGGESEQVRAAVVSPEFFALLGVRPDRGRTFRTEEDTQMFAVLSSRLWQSRFGADPAIVGRSITLSGTPFTVIGVMPPRFQYPSSEFQLWTTFGFALGVVPEQAENRSLRIFRALARLRPGVNLAEAQAQVDAVGARLARDHPETNAGVQIRFEPLFERVVGEVRPALVVLFGSVALLLLVACANVANLVLARTAAREREIGIRVALGAGRWRVARQLLTESLLLALLGGAAGLVLAWWGVHSLPALVEDRVPRADAIGIDGRVLLFTLGASLLTGLLFGLAPLVHRRDRGPSAWLHEGDRAMAGSRRGRRLRTALVVVEVSVALVVLIAAGLLAASFARLLGTELGIDPSHRLTATVGLVQVKDPQRRARVATEMLQRISAVGGVEVAGGGTGLPPMTAQRGTRFEIEGKVLTDPEERFAYFVAASPNYFRALGTPLLRGRFFDERDVAGRPEVVLVSRALASRIFGSEDPIGRHLRLVSPEYGSTWRTIVGVVGNVRYSGVDDQFGPAVYTPFAQTPFPWMYVVTRTHGEPGSVSADLKRAVASTLPGLTAAAVRPMETLVSASLAQPRVNTLLLSGFALLALALAMIGVYGVVGFAVAERTREIGVRVALGATRGDILRLVVRQGMTPVLLGVALGTAGALAATRLLGSLLYEISPTDPRVFAAVAALTLAIALLASFLPARRALAVDPARTLNDA
jgi:predicted permease